MSDRAMRLLAEYQKALAPERRRLSSDVEVFYFCSDEKSANTCADLVTRGIKTATCSLRLWYERGEPYSKLFPIAPAGITCDTHCNCRFFHRHYLGQGGSLSRRRRR